MPGGIPAPSMAFEYKERYESSSQINERVSGWSGDSTPFETAIR